MSDERDQALWHAEQAAYRRLNVGTARYYAQQAWQSRRPAPPAPPPPRPAEAAPPPALAEPTRPVRSILD